MDATRSLAMRQSQQVNGFLSFFSLCSLLLSDATTRQRSPKPRRFRLKIGPNDGSCKGLQTDTMLKYRSPVCARCVHASLFRRYFQCALNQHTGRTGGRRLIEKDLTQRKAVESIQRVTAAAPYTGLTYSRIQEGRIIEEIVHVGGKFTKLHQRAKIFTADLLLVTGPCRVIKVSRPVISKGNHHRKMPSIQSRLISPSSTTKNANHASLALANSKIPI